MIRRLILAAALAMAASAALAHDRWTNGELVPDFVKKYCCSRADVHRLNSSAVHAMADGYHIDGIKTVVPYNRVDTSPDGQFWAFWNPDAEPDPNIWCFFAPPNGS